MHRHAVLYLFDIDGTLLLTGGASAIALNQVFERRYGLLAAMERIAAGGKTDAMIVNEIFTTRLARTPEAAEIEAIIEEYVTLLRAALPRSARFRLMPAVHEALDFLAAQTAVHLAVATGNVRGGAQAKLEHCGLWTRFATGGGFGDDSPERPLLVQRAIERARTTAGIDFLTERIVVVGDTPYDIHAARACGVRVMAVATGSFDRATLESHEPDVVLDTLDELPAWHRNWFSPASAGSPHVSG